MDKMTPNELNLQDQLQTGYAELAERVEELLVGADESPIQGCGILHGHLLACRAALHKIRINRMMIQAMEGREIRTL